MFHMSNCCLYLKDCFHNYLYNYHLICTNIHVIRIGEFDNIYELNIHGFIFQLYNMQYNGKMIIFLGLKHTILKF